MVRANEADSHVRKGEDGLEGNSRAESQNTNTAVLTPCQDTRGMPRAGEAKQKAALNPQTASDERTRADRKQ